MADSQSSLVATPEPEKKLPSRWQLYRAYSSNEVLIVWGSSTQMLSDQYEELVSDFLKNASDQFKTRFNLSYKNINEIKESDLIDKILFVIGTPNENELIKN